MVVISRRISKHVQACAFIGVCFLLILSSYAHAHILNYGAIETTLEVKGNLIYLQTEVPQSIRYSSYYSSSTTEELYTRAFETSFIIEKDEVPCSFTLTGFDNSDPDRSHFTGMYVCSTLIVSIKDLQVHNSIFKDSFIQYDHYVYVRIKEQRWELVFTPTNTSYPDRVSATLTENLYDRFLAVFTRFTLLGAEHILKGYDHLLFLLSLLTLVRSTRKIILLVTTFTIAHSTTLLLAGLDSITIPSSIAEPAIDLTILYVTFQNLMTLQKKSPNAEPPSEWSITFLFGLIHGVGFAQVLRETSIPNDLIISSLLFFNVGIEFGQLLVLAVLVPILYKVDASQNRKQVLLGLTILTGVIALYWFIERIAALV